MVSGQATIFPKGITKKNMRTLRLLGILAIFYTYTSHLQAQQPPGSCPNNQAFLASTCGEACVLCDITGYQGFNVVNNMTDAPPGFCAPQLHNTQWIGFVAGSNSITFSVDVYNCGGGDGLQIGVYGTLDCTSYQQVSNCEASVPENTSATFNANGLEPGGIYFFVIDGAFGDTCQFTINVLDGSASAPTVSEAADIAGPTTICPGGTFPYMASDVFGASVYEWVFNGNTVGYDQIVDLTMPSAPGTYELCVTPSNPCSPNGPQNCTQITVAPLPTDEVEETICDGEVFTYQGNTFDTQGSYTFSYTDPQGCFRDAIVDLTVLSPTETFVEDEICQDELPFFVGIPGTPGATSITSTTNGYQQVNLQGSFGCDSIVYVDLQVNPLEFFLDVQVICEGDSYTVSDGIVSYTYNESTLEEIALTSSKGCDSTVFLNLTVTPVPAPVSLVETICAGEFYEIGSSYFFDQTGFYQVTFPSVGGCDSIISLNLTVLDSIYADLDIEICNGESYEVGNQSFSSSGFFPVDLTSIEFGCDSTVNLNLNVLEPISSDLDISICEGESYELGGNSYDSQGSYQEVFVSSGGCDSTVNLNLNILLDAEILLTESVCYNEVFQVGDSIFNSSGSYNVVLDAFNGCDSIVSLNLTVLDQIESNITDEICEDETIEIGQESFSETGSYEVTLIAQNGCDSIVYLDLEVIETEQTVLDISICEGGNYSIGQSIYNETGTYTEVTTSSRGCDSVITLNLNVVQPPETIINRQICTGQTFEVGSSSYTVTGDYIDTLQTVELGCDSIVFLNLIVEDILTESADITICEGESHFVDGNEYTNTGNYDHTYTTNEGCDSLFVLNLTVIQTQFTDLDIELCQGESIDIGASTYSSTGTFTETIPSLLTGCDSIVTLNLVVHPIEETQLNIQICDGESYELGGNNYTTQGIFEETFTSIHNCDSIVTLNLEVLEVPVTSLQESICDGESFSVGNSIYDISGSYQDILIAANGCDSFVNLQLTVLNVPEVTLDILICEGESFEVGSTSFDDSGDYTETLAAFNGCDSIVNLTLTVAEIQSTDITTSICFGSSYQVGNSSYDATGLYIDTLSSFQGCDSIITLDLTVTSFYEVNLQEEICEGETFEVGTSSYSETGDYSDQFISSDGCDSIVNLNLLVNEIPETDLIIEICQGDSYEVGTTQYANSGVFVETLTAITGCDSIVNLDLTVHPIYEITLSEAICEGESFEVGNSSYTQNGDYQDMLISENGCDSLVNLFLTVNPILTTQLNIEICEGESYEVGSSIYTVQGVYSNTLTSQTGCDSIISLDLIVIEPIETFLIQEICQGEEYEVGNSIYNTSGNYENLLPAANGCDSIVFLDLTVNQTYETILQELICDDESFPVGNENFSSDGVHEVLLSSIDGCDSLVILDLTTHPCQLGLTVSDTPPSCFEFNDGSISFRVNIGTPPYDFSWIKEDADLSGQGQVQANFESIIVENIGAGNYLFTISDFYNVIETFEVLVTQPDPVETSLQVSDYEGFNVSCAEGDDGQVIANVNGGTLPYQFNWSTNQTSSNIENLGPGSYSVTVIDQNGCIDTIGTTLFAPEPITTAIISNDPNCYGENEGSIIIDSTNGGVSPYLYTVNNEYLSASNIFSNLAVGTHLVQIQDANGCEIEQEVIINQPEELIVDLGDDQFIELGDSPDLLALTSYPVKIYNWTSSEELFCEGDSLDSNCPSPITTPFETTSYTIIVEDENGCKASDQITVFVDQRKDLFIPNVFSPNNDGNNDKFIIFGGNKVQNIESFLVFNRWGETVYQFYDFQVNDPNAGWDGTHRGQPLNNGVFVYLVEVSFIDGEKKIYKGDVLLKK